MALQGLRARQPTPVNVRDTVGASVEALDRLGLVADHEQLAESILDEFTALCEDSGRTGEAYVQLPRGLITLPTMIAVLDGGTYPQNKKYSATYVYNNLWTPGTDPNGLKAEDIGNLEADQQDAVWPAHVRVAVDSTESREPLLHFLGKPFDEMYADKGQETQLQAIAKAKAAYEAEHPDFAMTPLNITAVAMIALTRRIKGEPMPMEWGFMRDATLPRSTVDGHSRVGDVDSGGGQLELAWSDGDADSDGGVGLSVGPKQLDPAVKIAAELRDVIDDIKQALANQR